MAGQGKGKKKRSRPRNTNVYRQVGNSSSKSDHGPGEKPSHNAIESKESGEKISAPTSGHDDSLELEQLLFEKVELLFKIAMQKLMELGYGADVVIRATLMNGSIFGSTKILRNIFTNVLDAMKKGYATNDQLRLQPIFDDVPELVRFSMQTLINMILQEQPNMTKTEAILGLLQSNSLAIHGLPGDPIDRPELVEYLGKGKSTSKDDIEKMLEKKTAYMQRLTFKPTSNPPPPALSSSQKEVKPLVSDEEVTSPYFVEFESSTYDIVEFMKSITNCPDELRLEFWLNTCGEEKLDEFHLRMVAEIKKLEKKVSEKREWARNTVLLAAKRLHETMNELKVLRLEKNEFERILKEKEEYDRINFKLKRRESELRNVNNELGIMNQVKSILEAKNQEIQAEISAYNLSTSEAERSILATQKNERKLIKQCKDSENQVEDLKRLMEEEKQKQTEITMRLKQVSDEEAEARLRLRQEKEANAQAKALFLEERRLYKIEKENSKNRIAAVKEELDMEYRKLMDKQKSMELEVSNLKIQRASPSRSSSCMICRNNDVTIVFLPCAHQLICTACNDEVYEALEDVCPCCFSHIDRRVQVFGPGQ